MADPLEEAIEASKADIDARTSALQEVSEAAGDDEEPAQEEASEEQDEVEPEESAEDVVETEESDDSEGTEAAEEQPDEPAEEPEEDSEAEDSEPEGEEPEESEEPEAEAVELSEDTVVVLPDGTELTGQELHEGRLRQEDYTKKTQQLAEEREQVQGVYERMESWYQERVNDPDSWVAEIADGTDSPAATIANALEEVGDPTDMTALVIKELAETGRLDQEFVETLGIQEIANTRAEQSDLRERLRRTEERLEEREQTEQERQEQQKILQQFEAQWNNVKSREGFEFSSQEEEYDAKVSLMQFAHDRGIPDLEQAWAVMVYEHEQQGAGQAQKQQPEPEPEDDNSEKEPSEEAQEAIEKKRKTSAMQSKPTGGPSPKPKTFDTTEDAVADALAEMKGTG